MKTEDKKTSAKKKPAHPAVTSGGPTARQEIPVEGEKRPLEIFKQLQEAIMLLSAAQQALSTAAFGLERQRDLMEDPNFEAILDSAQYDARNAQLQSSRLAFWMMGIKARYPSIH